MYGSELRTCRLGAVVAVLLGAGIGLGWHYLDNVGGKAAVASVATPFEKQDAPKPPLTCPPGSRGGPALDVPSFPFYPAPTTSPTQPTQRVRWGSCTPRTLAVPDRCHVPTGLMGDERTACLIAGALRLARPPLVLFLGASGFVSGHSPTMPRKDYARRSVKAEQR